MARVPILCVLLCLFVHLHCMPLLEEPSRIPTSDEIAFLKRFGYLPNSPAGTEFAFDSYSLSEVVRLFQSYGGLTPTGIIDAQTEQLFKKPRCGNKDLFIYDDDTSRRKRYVILRGGGWKKRHLTYKFITKSSMLSSTLVDQYFAWALAAWAAHAGLTFTQVKEGTADINVGFYSGDHGCGYPYRFDGKDGVLAHAFAPDAGGALHFDDDENWYEDDESSEMNMKAITFFNTALHEIGHVLGLNHTTVPGAVMLAIYQENGTFLADDDVQGIKALYRTRNDSRIEYARLPGRQHDGFDLTITLRTFDKHGGLLFYAAAEKSPQQFLAVYMKQGKLTMAFNCGADTVVVRTEQTFADTEWHTVTIVRNGGGGKISVDHEPIGQATGMCLSPAALAPPFYYGGLRDVTPDIKKNLEDFYQPFKGCFKGLLINGQRVTDILFTVNSLQCRDDVEEGIYFGPSTPDKSNYLVLDSKFRVGRDMFIQLEIKPRNSTGLLLSVHGEKDFLVLELLENAVVANVENGKGPFRAIYTLGNKFSLCDGQWHKIFVAKSGHVVSVGVDGRFSDPGIGQSGYTDTKSALYIGGHKRDLSKVKGVRSQRGYIGCMRNIVIKEKARRIPLNAAHGNVHVGVCPTD